MALPPHIIKKKIDAMPDGPEKEKKLKSFRLQLKIGMWIQLIMLIAMGIMTTVTIIVYLVKAT